jgi:hypothetical protein
MRLQLGSFLGELTMMRNLIASSLAVLILCVPALAVDIPASSSVGAVPASPGDGLNGRYWQLAPKTIGEDPNALKLNGFPIIASTAPTATFTSTALNYTGDDLTPIGTWLGSDAGSLVGGNPAVNNMDDGLLSFTGYLAVEAPATWDFYMPSDDGSILDIGGVRVIDNDGSHGSPGPAPNGQAKFTAAGLYPVEITYYNGDWTDPNDPNAHGGANIAWRLGTADADPLVSTAILYTVPEPAALALAGLGSLAGLMMLRRRK